MIESLQTALSLMVIGMLTVFTVLLLVVWGGKFLIFLTNRYLSEDRASETLITERKKNKNSLVVLTAVVEHLTSGKGRIQSIKKLK